ncbi:phytanoyl-CoA dioxygenase family protein [Acidobacteria bacterium AH-259-G07]|nr:phytanoyl-CoA dioxygenase family protein [Acidobacteria bacterium AH-259-G07]
MFEAKAPLLSESQLKVVQQLTTRGISFMHFDELFGDHERWDSMREAADGFVNSEAVEKKIQAYHTNFEKTTWKEYLVRLFPESPIIALDDPWLQLGIDGRILDVVNTYLGLWARLMSIDLWYTIPLGIERSRTGSQRWHRDPEDRKMVKVFLYFSEVAHTAGPLQYIPGSCTGGPYRHLWRTSGPTGQPIPSEGELEAKIPRSEWITCSGSTGTFVFCDTSGLHRGGYATEQERVLAMWCFLTPASLWPRRFTVDWDSGECQLTEAAKFALS